LYKVVLLIARQPVSLPTLGTRLFKVNSASQVQHLVLTYQWSATFVKLNSVKRKLLRNYFS